jgi:N utilization substance protein B
MGIRRKSREIAVQAIYMYDVGNISLEQLLLFDWIKEKDSNVKILKFSTELIKGTIENISKIDNTINKVVNDELSLKRMGIIEKSIVRIMTYEMLFTDVPELALINEGIEISKKYGGDYSHKFINGILDGVRKDKLNNI